MLKRRIEKIEKRLDSLGITNEKAIEAIFNYFVTGDESYLSDAACERKDLAVVLTAAHMRAEAWSKKTGKELKVLEVIRKKKQEGA